MNAPRPMRVLLTANASYDPPRGGSTRGNLVWLQALAARGHACRVVCSASGDREGNPSDDRLQIRCVPGLSHHVAALGDEIRTFQPDWVLVSSEDVSHSLLREAQRNASGRIVYLAHTPQFFPFGPASWFPDREGAGIVKSAAAIVVISRHMQEYVRQHLGLEASLIHPPIYGSGPFPCLGSFDNPVVLMVNPCAVKGLSIFLEMARRFPEQQFAALAGWGTTGADRVAMAALPNVRVLETVPHIGDALRQARVLLMPSLWYEGFGLIAMEAMLRGIPVVASDAGLGEAKAETGFVVPVQPIERYEHAFDEVHMPIPVIPPQNLDRWSEALATLIRDRAEYEAEAERSRRAALHFVAGLRAPAFEELLASLSSGTAHPPLAVPHKRHLSPAKRALLLRRLRG